MLWAWPGLTLPPSSGDPGVGQPGPGSQRGGSSAHQRRHRLPSRLRNSGGETPVGRPGRRLDQMQVRRQHGNCTSTYKLLEHQQHELHLITVSRLEWPRDHYFPPCVLKFRDGWEPAALPGVTRSREAELTQLAESLANAEIQRQEELTMRLAQEVRLLLL